MEALVVVLALVVAKAVHLPDVAGEVGAVGAAVAAALW